jgi:hypothetical protein
LLLEENIQAVGGGRTKHRYHVPVDLGLYLLYALAMGIEARRLRIAAF